jgi:hypothetical protein
MSESLYVMGIRARFSSAILLAASAWALPAAAQPALSMKADAGAIRYPFVVTNGLLQSASEPGTTNAGEAIYEFTLTNSGDYVLRARVAVAGPKTDSLSLNIDAEPSEPGMIWDIAATHGLENRFVTWRGNLVAQPKIRRPKAFRLSKGTHRLFIRGRGGAVKVEGIELDMLPPPPPTRVHVEAGR